MKKLMSRAVNAVHFMIVYLLGKTLGIGWVVRHLRNPNPKNAARLLRAFGATVGRDSTIKGSLIIDNTVGDKDSTGDFSHLDIGKNCYIGEGVFLDLANQIVIEDNAVIAARASFLTHAQCKRSPYINARFPRKTGPVVVGSGAWVGFGVTVLHGVTIGQNSVIGANSLVIENTTPRCVYVGSPAKPLRQIEHGPQISYSTSSEERS